MLVEFESNGYPSITMLGEVARKLLKKMGMSGNVPSAINGRDVGNALRDLRSGLDAAGSPSDGTVAGGDDGDELPVSLAVRAFPLLEMMAVASKNEYDILWKERN